MLKIYISGLEAEIEIEEIKLKIEIITILAIIGEDKIEFIMIEKQIIK